MILTSAAPLRRTSLDSSADVTWTLTAASATEGWDALGATSVPATVPGEVHRDLLQAGLIPDPFDGDNESALAWIGRTDWMFSTTFTWDGGPESRHDLVADGLDTIATVVLNGVEIARTANEHRSYRFDITQRLTKGENTLQITFEAPTLAAERLSHELGERP